MIINFISMNENDYLSYCEYYVNKYFNEKCTNLLMAYPNMVELDYAFHKLSNNNAILIKKTEYFIILIYKKNNKYYLISNTKYKWFVSIIDYDLIEEYLRGVNN